MSRLQRAVEKAEREGLLTWTRPADDRARSAAAVVEPPVSVAHEDGLTSPLEAPLWIPTDAAGGRLSPILVAATDPRSSAAEQFRLLRARLERRSDAGSAQLLLVTSPRRGEGKTTTSANLALTIARDFQHEVVLVEADLRQPRLAASFDIHAEVGLADVLVGAVQLEDALVPVPGQHLFLLPAGLPTERSTELLASPAMQGVMQTLRTRFRQIIVDTPPSSLADTHVLARLADGIIIVVRAGVTPRPALERALAGVDRQRLMGIVLNDAESSPEEYGYSGLRSAAPRE